MFFAIGCQSAGPRVTQDGYAEDFQLAVLVRGEPNASNDDLSRGSYQTAVYIIESDRSLHAAVGPGASWKHYPPRTALLTPAQMSRLQALAQQVAATQTQAPPTPQASPSVTLRLQILSKQQQATQSLAGLPLDHPAHQFVRELAHLRGEAAVAVAPATQTQPATLSRR